MQLSQKKLLKFFVTQKNQDLKKAVLYGGGSVLEARCLHSGASWRPEVSFPQLTSSIIIETLA